MVTPPPACLTMGLKDTSSLSDFKSKASLAMFGFLGCVSFFFVVFGFSFFVVVVVGWFAAFF